MLRTVARMLRLVWSVDLRAREIAACSDRDLPYELRYSQMGSVGQLREIFILVHVLLLGARVSADAIARFVLK
jgi:hypothetical protein